MDSACTDIQACVGVSHFTFILTDITLEPKLFWDVVQANQRCVSNFLKDAGEDARGLGAVMYEITHN